MSLYDPHRRTRKLTPSDEVSERQATELLCLPPNTLRKWRLEGMDDMPPHSQSGASGRVIYRRGDLLTWAAERATRSARADATDMLTEEQAARYIGRARETLRAWRTRRDLRGRGPAYHQPGAGRHVRYRRRDLDTWLRANRFNHGESLK